MSALPGSPALPTAAFTARIQAFRERIEGVLDRALELPDAGTSRLREAMRYSVLGAGKRLRPTLVYLTGESLGAPLTVLDVPAAAVELIHVYSLVHDDLPAMDDDDVRRGRPTSHRVYGEGLAILVGDGLLTEAFRVLARARGVPPARVLRVVAEIAAAAGEAGMVGGQALDLAASGRRVSLARVRDIHRRKTGALIACSLQLGALVGGAGEARVGELGALGRRLGLAFQIHDDLLDRGSSLRRLGKRAGRDAARGKATYPRAVGEQRARLEAERLYAGVARRIRGLGPRATALGEVVLAAAERVR